MALFFLAGEASFVSFYLGRKPEDRGVWGSIEAAVLILESCAGPRPSLMMARESGMSLVCQPLSS